MPKGQPANLAVLLKGLEALPPDDAPAAGRLDAAVAQAAETKRIRADIRQTWAGATHGDRRAAMLSFVRDQTNRVAELRRWAEAWVRMLEGSRPVQADGRPLPAEALEGLRADFGELLERSETAELSGAALAAALERGAAALELDTKKADFYEATEGFLRQLGSPAIRAVLETTKEVARQRFRGRKSKGKPKQGHAWQAAVARHLHDQRPDASDERAFRHARRWAKPQKIEGEDAVFLVYWHEPANALQCEGHMGQLGFAGFKKRRATLK